MNYYEHHLGDYAAATAHLSWDEDMAYTRLLRAYYHHERGIPEGQAYRLARASSPAQRRAVDVVLAEFFVLADGEHTQKRAEEEVARFQDKQRKAKASAEARWSHTERNANAMRTHSEGNAPSLQTPDTIPKEKEKPRKRVPRPEDVSEQVWEDWTALRKAKRATVSETVLSEARGEAHKAGLTLERFLSLWCARGSQGLQAEWLTPKERSAALSFRERDEAAAAARHAEFTGRKADPLDNVIDMEPAHARIGNR